MSQRVVITGMGVVSPVGSTVDSFWDSLIHGRSGIGAISYFDTTNFAVKVAGEVKGFDVSEYVDPKEAKRLDKFLQYAIGAAVQAVSQSGLADSPSIDKSRVGVVIGCGIGGLGTIEGNHGLLQNRGPSRVSPFFVPMSIIDMASGMVSIRYGFMGPNFGVVSACSSAGHAFIEGVNLIRLGKVDAMVCGGSEGCVTPLAIAGFNSAQALSTGFNDTPSRASRPFDKGRDGFVMGEGAGILILESLDSAKKRGAKIFAEIVGYGMSGDAYHITAPHPEGTGSILAFREALRDGGIDASQVDYINAHGTSTPLNDKTETKVIKQVLGADLCNKVSVSSTKSMTGHMIGAAAAVESVATILAMQNSIVPPTINYEEPDPDCDLDITPNVAKERPIRYALKNSLGFGGHNAAVLFKRWEE